jgi:hypothetical protein
MLHDPERHDSHENDSEAAAPRRFPRANVAWYAATAVSLAANAYLLLMTHDLADSAVALRDTLSAQIDAVDRKATAAGQETAQRLDTVSADARKEAAAALQQATTDNRRTAAKVASTLAAREAEQRKVASDVSDLKAAEESASARLDQVNGDVQSVKGDVSGVKADVASTRSAVDDDGAELRRVRGDMGVMSGLIATNGKQLDELRALGERNYFEFDIKKSGAGQKIGDVRLALRKTDPKKNRFTLDVLADDKTTEKRDRTIDEPIQFYVAGGRQPYEIVVNTVTKDEIVGYLATPKTQVASR